jgi:heme o synthase
MLPVVKGAAATRRQILIYTVLLVPLGIAPAFTGLGGAAYLAVSGLGGLAFLLLAWRLFRSRAGESPDPRMDDGLYDVRAGAKDARNLFAFSILYIAVLFATLLVERLADLPPLELFR